MAEGMNQWTGVGNLGENADLRFGQSGTAVLSWSMACTTGYYDAKAKERKTHTEWMRCVLFGKLGETLAPMMTKGKTITVTGEIRTEKYEKDGQTRYSTKVYASNIFLMSGGGSESGGLPPPRGGTNRAPSGGASAQRQKPPPDDFGYDGGDGNEIPFASPNPSRRERWGL